MYSAAEIILFAPPAAKHNNNTLFIIPGACVPMKIYENGTSIA